MSSNITKNFKAKSALRKEHGGDVKGPGGPTDDKVGPVMLSDGEYVLPADTVDAVGVDNLDALRDATHDFESTAGKTKIPGRLRGMAAGGVFYVDPEGRAARGPALPQTGTSMVPARPQAPQLPATQTAPPRAAPAPAPAGPSFAARAGAATRQAIGTGLRGVGALGAASMAANGLTDEVNAVRTGTNNVGRSAVNAGDTAAGLLGTAASLGARLNPVTGAAATGWMAGRAIGGMLPDSVNDSIGKGVDTLVRGAGKLVGQQWGTPDYAAPAAAKPPTAAPSRGATPVADVLGKPAMANEKPPTGPQYYADLELQHQQEIAQRAAGNREAGARMQAAGGPGAYNQGMLENRSGLPNSDPRINGSTSAAYNALGDDAVVGSYNGRSFTKKEADARAAGLQTASFMPQKPAEDPIMGEIRSALRGMGGGARGGSSFSGRDSGTDAINKRYDDLLRGGTGRNVVKGSDWSQRHGLSVEKERAKELSDYAQNQSTLRGQDNAASIAADQNRTQLANTLINAQTQREKALAEGKSAAEKAQQDAIKANEGRSKDAMASMNDAIDRFAAGDKDVAADLARVASTVPADLRAAIDSLPASDRPGAWSSVFDAYNAQSEGFVAGRDVGATAQNTLLGAGVGASMPGIGRGVGYVGDLAGTLLTRGRYRGTALRDLLGSRAGSAALGAGVGAFATPETQTTGRLDMPMVDENGLPTQANATFVEALKHGAYDTNKPWATLQRGESGKLQANDYTDDELAAIRDLTSLRRFGRE